jgi:ABC-type oligopeptide transport system ATPase subunit
MISHSVMRNPTRLVPSTTRAVHTIPSPRHESRTPLITIQNATFYQRHPSSDAVSSTNPPLFPSLTFEIPSYTSPNEHWAVTGSSARTRTAFLEILRSRHICVPPIARTYPFLSSPTILRKDPHLRNPLNAIQYVGFDAERGGLGGSSMRGSYLSARYEARKEETDFSLMEYLKGNTELNPVETAMDNFDHQLLGSVLEELNLKDLMDMPASNLSNGQTRRARIAKSLMVKPELLLLDGPFSTSKLPVKL